VGTASPGGSQTVKVWIGYFLTLIAVFPKVDAYLGGAEGILRAKLAGDLF
jgi:hypothetical protein